jgi:hypothetical protein
VLGRSTKIIIPAAFITVSVISNTVPWAELNVWGRDGRANVDETTEGPVVAVVVVDGARQGAGGARWDGDQPAALSKGSH